MKEEIPSEKLNLSPNMKIVGFNLLALAVYTYICTFFHGIAPIIDSFFLFVHVIICLIKSELTGKKAWRLSAVLILLIGLSTCTGILKKL